MRPSSILLALLLPALATAAEQSRDPARAAEVALATDPNRALELALEALATGPESADLRALVGRAAAQAARPELAVEHLERALELGGESLQLRLYLASALWEIGRYEQAEASFRRACEGSGTGARGLLAWHQLGRLLLWLGRAPEAVPVLERAVALGPRAPDAALDLARALELAGDPRALAAFERAVALAPESPRARWGLAQSLLAAGRREEAGAQLVSYRDLYQKEQESVRAEGLERANLDQAWALLRGGDGAAAALAFARLGDGAEALEGLARAELARGRRTEASAVLEHAVRRYPDDANLAQLLERVRLAVLGEEQPP